VSNADARDVAWLLGTYEALGVPAEFCRADESTFEAGCWSQSADPEQVRAKALASA
jgi:hypothetical protein